MLKLVQSVAALLLLHLGQQLLHLRTQEWLTGHDLAVTALLPWLGRDKGRACVQECCSLQNILQPKCIFIISEEAVSLPVHALWVLLGSVVFTLTCMAARACCFVNYLPTYSCAKPTQPNITTKQVGAYSCQESVSQKMMVEKTGNG